MGSRIKLLCKLWAGLAALCALTVLCASCGPRMRDQASILPFEQAMPPMPAGTVSTKGRMATFTQTQAALASAPVAPTARSIGDGKIFYRYYCLMCHGEKGDGNGPVGESYVPKPADLASPKIAAMTDGQLYRAMLRGKGHDPVMNQTVRLEYRWPLVAYVRTFAK
ncbi:MAG: c-type cytochrome [Armatimonadetes bacterium]|nr:c-type cytochrome [Armatimonadota bacterium]